MTPGEAAIGQAVVRLRAAGCVFAEDEAAVLAEAAADDQALAEFVDRRAQGEPLEQVVGYADFCGVRVRLRPGVFVPRVRSELLVRLATDALHDRLEAGTPEAGKLGAATAPRPTVVDLCCGSGALGMAVQHRNPGIDLHSADIDPIAVATARDNLRTPVHQGDLFAALPAHLAGRIDVLIANVPYVATPHLRLLPAEARDHEPRTALDGGLDGLDVLRAITTQVRRWLAPGGVLLSEITAVQREAARKAVRAAGLDADVVTDDDLEAQVIRGRDRKTRGPREPG